MVYQPEVIPGSPQGQALQASIQKQLAFHGWSTEDDTVMAEYCLVMLGNRKTAEQISTELSDLIGGDFDPSFTTWLFKELSIHYPDPSGSSSSISAPPSQQPTGAQPSPPAGPRNISIAGAGGSRGGNGNGNAGGRGVFGQAMSGVKRDSREMGGGEPERQRAKYERPQQQGYENVPSGPRQGGPQGQGRGAGGGGARGGRNGQGGNIFDRVGGQNPGFDNSQSPNAFNNGPNQGNNNNFNMTPQMMAQAQAQAMAFAALAWQQQQGGGGQNGQMPPGFNPFMGQMNGGGAFPMPSPPMNGGGGGRGGFGGGAGGGGRGGFHQNQHHQQQHQIKPAVPVAPLPTKPLQEAICKHATECTKPNCPFSHPSPVATKESGLVLSSEACEKGLACEDADCPKSHVSKAQKNAPATPAPAPTPAAPVVDPQSIPGAGEKMCKFAGSCTRPGCVFLHPWDQRETGGTVPCKWGEQCTRADCHFSHPPNRINVYLAAKAAKKTSSSPATTNATGKYSAVFNKPGTSTGGGGGGIGAWPSESKDHVSDRLKRFGEEGGGEKIIPGQGEGELKVEIDVEDDKKE